MEYTVFQPEGSEEEVSDHVEDFVEKARASGALHVLERKLRAQHNCTVYRIISNIIHMFYASDTLFIIYTVILFFKYRYCK